DGMGAVEIGRTLQSQGAAYLAVAVVDEAVALRNAGITMPIMVLNPVTNQSPALFAYNIEPAVFSLDELCLLVETAVREGVSDFPIHIKLDTGMHRVGFIEEQLDGLIESLAAQKSLVVSSVFTHLATADCLDLDDYTQLPLQRFYAMTDKLRKGLGRDFKRHILNTAGMMRFAECGPYEMTRLGIGLYGVSPLPPSVSADLQPVATFKSRIISLKHWPAGTPVGYGCRGVTSRDSVVATVPVGYADGVNRRLGRGNASFVVRGVACPTIGNICMDLCMIDVTDAQGVSVGDEVEIFGPSASVEALAETLGTIPYELFTWVSPRVRRIYYRK
ncbi:MAG: alanine racemase, partial [Muribaculaceae bacterium]|nr:alanine racemase [Muribaculaceae bacterium]